MEGLWTCGEEEGDWWGEREVGCFFSAHGVGKGF